MNFFFLGGGGVGAVGYCPDRNSLELCWELEIWYVDTHTYLVSENIPFSTKAHLILLMPAFFCKISLCFGRNSIFTQSNSESSFKGFLVLFSVFVR